MRRPNRLIDEKSPYLLQHAYNPVDWYPWGKEAFTKADEEDKPIFLSIGYSTCHWCHVMEEECFTDDQVAELMNEAFINIKVDREERPDIDKVYMTVSQILTGSGGWPLTIIMTPDRKPFYAATYVPKETIFGRIGMLDLIPQIMNYWKNQRERLVNITENVEHNLGKTRGGDEELTKKVLDSAFNLLTEMYDDENGGFGVSPKFPTPHNILFLLRYWNKTRNKTALKMVQKTLDEMRKGGIYDQIGYGFHRYSTDNRWLVPHFEKMLYDQAMLIMAYTEAYQATKNPAYKTISEETITYVLRDLSSPYGGFYSAEDADSEGEEGKFYLWTVEELEEALNQEEYMEIIKYFNVRPEGNHLEEATRQKTGKNILHLRDILKENETVTRAKNILFLEREKRVRPFLDDKILTDWNGLMIAALSKAGKAFEINEYVAEAVRAAEFIIGRMWDGSKLLHRFREDEAEINGFLDDYAFMIWAMIELYQATYEVKYLDLAIKLNQIVLDNFRDPDGGFYFTAKDSEKLLTKRKELYDGAIPSGNSVVFYNLLRLSRLTGDISLQEEAQKLARFFSSSVAGQPHAYTMFLSGLDFALGPTTEVILKGNRKELDVILKEISREYLPDTVTHIWSKELAEKIPYLSKIDSEEKTMIYVCKDFVCNLPTDNAKNALEQIKK